MSDGPAPAPGGTRHAVHEDVLAIVAACLLASLGVVLHAKAALLTGGVPGLALLVSYVSTAGFWLGFIVLNLPLIALGWRRRGPAFVMRTGCAIALQSALVEGGMRWIEVATINPTYAAIVGGLLIGIALLILFRHDASFGGIGILALHLQDRFDIRAGYVLLAFDSGILSIAALVLPVQHRILSVAGVLVLNGVLAVHHRPGRYIGVTRPIHPIDGQAHQS